ncbi:hypothetical protein PR048_033449 [Dryococelus australis]|uniref:Uncharacterized protein n=1 Tax=Dryococelus australis TaxID=614101 RepID=A0ABQ9G0B6_9NEOP|nr:hypothetical protein PR048_033449 [Dryococelus australis]
MLGRGTWEIPEKTRRPAPSSGTAFTCENPEATQPGIEPGSPSGVKPKDWPACVNTETNVEELECCFTLLEKNDCERRRFRGGEDGEGGKRGGGRNVATGELSGGDHSQMSETQARGRVIILHCWMRLALPSCLQHDQLSDQLHDKLEVNHLYTPQQERLFYWFLYSHLPLFYWSTPHWECLLCSTTFIIGWSSATRVAELICSNQMPLTAAQQPRPGVICFPPPPPVMLPVCSASARLPAVCGYCRHLFPSLVSVNPPSVGRAPLDERSACKFGGALSQLLRLEQPRLVRELMRPRFLVCALRERCFSLSQLSPPPPLRPLETVVAERLAGSSSDRVTPGFSQVGIVPDDAPSWRVFSGISRPPPVHSLRRCSILASITLIGSQDFDVKSGLNLFTHARAYFFFCTNHAADVDIGQQPPAAPRAIPQEAGRRHIGRITALAQRE